MILFTLLLSQFALAQDCPNFTGVYNSDWAMVGLKDNPRYEKFNSAVAVFQQGCETLRFNEAPLDANGKYNEIQFNSYPVATIGQNSMLPQQNFRFDGSALVEVNKYNIVSGQFVLNYSTERTANYFKPYDQCSVGSYSWTLDNGDIVRTAKNVRCSGRKEAATFVLRWKKISELERYSVHFENPRFAKDGVEHQILVVENAGDVPKVHHGAAPKFCATKDLSSNEMTTLSQLGQPAGSATGIATVAILDGQADSVVIRPSQAGDLVLTGADCIWQKGQKLADKK